jgi:hypothetical protein
MGTWGTNWEPINHLWEPHDVLPKLDFFFFTASHFDWCNFFILFTKKIHWTLSQKKFALPKGNSLNVGYERSSLGKGYGINPLLSGVFIHICIN